MYLLKKQFAFLILIFIAIICNGQYRDLSSDAEVSIITIGQGHLLNDSFGHSAIRIKDIGFDKIYNYGIFPFHEKGFYLNFMRGKLLYEIGTNNTFQFFKYYANQNREIREQVLELTLKEKQTYFEFLENNAKPENKKYLYDFFFDNCATRLRDVNTLVLKDKVNYKDELLNGNFTFRDLITQKLDKQVWGKFGIDIALGSVIDRKATAKESTFLPDYVFKNFKNAKISIDKRERPLVKKTNYIYKKNEEIKMTNKDFFLTPMSLFILIGLVILFITLKDYKQKKQSKWLDFIILFSTGLVGIVVFLLWFATDHKATGNNFNIFWAFTPNVVMAFYVFKNKLFLQKYYLLLLCLLGVTIFLWILKIQVFNLGLIPILIFLAIRYFYNWKLLKVKYKVKI